MKSTDVKSSTYIDSSQEINDKGTKFKIDDIVRVLKYKNILEKVSFQIGLKKLLQLQKLKILCRGHVISNLKSEEIVGTFYKKELEKTH